MLHEGTNGICQVAGGLAHGFTSRHDVRSFEFLNLTVTVLPCRSPTCAQMCCGFGVVNHFAGRIHSPPHSTSIDFSSLIYYPLSLAAGTGEELLERGMGHGIPCSDGAVSNSSSS